MSIPIYSWQIYCSTEEQYVTYYGPTAPTTCPNNSSHSVTGSRQIALLNPPTMQVTDNSILGGNFQCTTIPITIPATAVVPATITVNKTYPFDMQIWEVSFSCPVTSITDTLDVQIGKDTPIGTTTASVSAAATSIVMTPVGIAKLTKGGEIGIQNGETKEYPGLITAIDLTSNTVTFSTPLTNSFPSGSVILYSLYPVRNFIFDSIERITLGSKGLKGKVIPAGTQLSFMYTDNTILVSPSTCYIQLQYYYV